jgi:hypothetical protein
VPDRAVAQVTADYSVVTDCGRRAGAVVRSINPASADQTKACAGPAVVPCRDEPAARSALERTRSFGGTQAWPGVPPGVPPRGPGQAR